MGISVKWLWWSSIKKNFDWKEFIALVIPTTFAYYDALDKLYKKVTQTECPNEIAVSTTIFILILLILFDIFRNYRKKIKAISEALETGYFNNFFNPTFTVLMDKLSAGQSLIFDFKDTSKSQIVTKKIEVIIILPKSRSKLTNEINHIKKITQEATVNGSWVNIEVLESGNVKIHECPKTLTTINKFLATGQDQYTEKDSIKYHKYFIDKFNVDYDPTKFNFEVRII